MQDNSMEELNITELIENNPITKLSNTYNNKFLIKVKDKFSDFEQQLFVSSFYCYLNYDKSTDFVIDLDNVWKWLGFNQKIDCRRLLEKHFVIDVDYSTSINPNENNTNEETKKWGGQNIKKIFLTTKCFKYLCLKSHTKKSFEIHDYYVKLQDILYETLEEETNELKNQLTLKNNLITEIEKKSEEEKSKLKQEKNIAIENSILLHFPVNTQCIYIGTIENTNDKKENLIKFGQTNNLSARIIDHKKTYKNFNLIHAVKVHNKVEIENLIKNDSEIKKQIRSINISGKNKTEIIAYNLDFTIEKLINCIDNILQLKVYNIDNFNALIKQNKKLEDEIFEIKENMKIIAEKIENQNLSNNKKEKLFEEIIHDNDYNKNNNNNNDNYNNIQNSISTEFNKISEKNLDGGYTFRFNQFINECCILSNEEKELSTNIECRFRIWNQQKPTKEIFHALKQYMDNRFKQDRVKGAHRGYLGISLKPMEYKKIKLNSDAENFVFQECTFSDRGKILNSVLLYEYQNWKKTVGKEIHGEEMNELKEYLNECPYAIKSVVWTEYGNNEGYYGLSPKKNETQNYKKVVNGKNVYKRKTETNELLGKWTSIATAAQMENIPTTRMSRYVKNKTIIDNDYYYATE